MAAFDPEKITFFAKTDARGQDIPFGIKAKDRQRHMYVVGKTGMGKSTLLENMAAQDILNGEGVAFIDPHGSAAEVLLDYVPEHRINDVVYFAPFDMEHPISFNVMEDVAPEKRHLVVSGLMSTFKKIWVDAWSARMEYILTNTLLALIEYPDTTLLSVNRMLADKQYRNQVVDYIKDPAVKAFWTEEFAGYTERFAAEALPAIQNKVGQFTGNPLIRNIIGQPHSSFDIRKMMDEKKILIMNLSKGLIGETNANLLGSMLTTRIYLDAMSRADLHVDEMKKMPNFYFYVDEFQSFANSTFANILSEARKYHLNLIIAHQYIEQMEEDVRNAVFGNVGTTIAFRVGPFDAEVLETVFTPQFLATDLVNLGFAQIYLTLMIDGIGSQPFSAKTLPPVQRPSVSYRNMVIAASRKNYAKERVFVEKQVLDLHNPAERMNRDDGKKKGGGNNNGNNGNGNGKPKGNSSNGNGSSPVREQRTPPNESVPKTAEDLRSILASVVKKDEPVAVPAVVETAVSQPTPPQTPAETTVTTSIPEAAPAATSARIQTPEPKPNHVPRDNRAPQSEKKFPRPVMAPAEKMVKAPQPAKAEPAVSPLRAALAAALKDAPVEPVATPVPAQPQASTAAPTSTPTPTLRIIKTEPQPVAVPIPTALAQPAPPSRSQIDLKKIKQMLRDGGDEPSPFQ